ncbi:MAG: fumarylacetoacetase [Roseobacter sp.]
MARIHSWLTSANAATTPFPIENLPLGVFSSSNGVLTQGVAIGDKIVDMRALAKRPVFARHPESAKLSPDLFMREGWNAFMAAGPDSWRALRVCLADLFTDPAAAGSIDPCLVELSEQTMHMPFVVAEYTDFYASKWHATNVGTMFRGAQNALPPNWLHIPIGYNGRASSVVVSGTGVRRPWGQIKPPDAAAPSFGPSARFDIELELGAIVGQASHAPLSVAEADKNIFGYVLLNDWSARDIQSWEYQPLGPFQSKATATTISPWIVMKAALDPFRVAPPVRDVPLLPHLQDDQAAFYDLDLEVFLQTPGHAPERVSRTNARELYYSAAQQLAHHSSSGCPMNVGDLLGSGTISGSGKQERGSLLEMSWNGDEPLTLRSGDTRRFLHDGDRVSFAGAAKAADYQIGFGPCEGHVLPALSNPYGRI